MNSLCSMCPLWQNVFNPSSFVPWCLRESPLFFTPLKTNTSFSKNNASILQHSQPTASMESAKPFTKNISNRTDTFSHSWKLIDK